MLYRFFRIIRTIIRRNNSALATMPGPERSALLEFINDSTL